MLIRHDLSIVARVCDWIAVMQAGRVVESVRRARCWSGQSMPIRAACLPRYRRACAERQSAAERGVLVDDSEAISAAATDLGGGPAIADAAPDRQYRGCAGRVRPRGDGAIASSTAAAERGNRISISGRGRTGCDVDGGWKIARRRLVLDQNVLTAKKLSIFF